MYRHLSRLANWTASFVALIVIANLVSTSGSGQQVAQPASTRQLGIDLPPGVKPRAGRGEALLLQSATGASPVVQLHCALGDYSIVMLPAGELRIVTSRATRPTNDPFVAAAPEAMIESLKSSGLPKFKFVEADPYLFAYDCSEGFYMHARSILESMLPGVVESLRSWEQTITRPATPLVVVIFPSRAAFDAFKRVPDEIIAYYNVLTNHVVMYEDQRLWDAAPEFAAKQAAYTIAHEGVHQLLANTGIQRRLSHWPPWICEGLPEYYCPLRVNSNLVRKGNAELPRRTLRWTRAGMVNDLRMYHLLRINAGSGAVLKQLLAADEIDSGGYALAWGVVHYLASEKPDAFGAYLRDVSKFEPLDSANRMLAGRPDPYFVKHFGDDFAALERGIQEHLSSRKMQAEYMDPIENQTHYVVKSVEKRGRSFAIQLAITTSPEAARKWKEAEEAANKKATFFTKICKSRREAEREVRKLQGR